LQFNTNTANITPDVLTPIEPNEMGVIVSDHVIKIGVGKDWTLVITKLASGAVVTLNYKAVTRSQGKGCSKFQTPVLKSRYNDPTDFLDDIVYPNSTIQKNTKIDRNFKDKVFTLSTTLTAGWDETRFKEKDAKEFINDIEKFWGNVSIKIGELTYKYSVKITLAQGFVSALNPEGTGDINFVGCPQCKGVGNTAKGDRAGTNIYIRSAGVPGSIAHEFGHILGFGHRLNSTGSIQSYAADIWEVTQKDLLDVYKRYGSK